MACVDTDLTDEAFGSQGEELVTALERFIVASITPRSHGRADKGTRKKEGAHCRPFSGLRKFDPVSVPESVYSEKSIPNGAVALVSRREFCHTFRSFGVGYHRMSGLFSISKAELITRGLRRSSPNCLQQYAHPRTCFRRNWITDDIA